MKPTELSIVERADSITQVSIAGRLDAVGVDKIGLRFQSATAARGKNTIIDLSDVDFIASLGLGMLLSAARALHYRGARAVVVNPHPLVLKVMEAAHMPSVIPVVATVADAESFFSD